jgi:hypothetical protein
MAQMTIRLTRDAETGKRTIIVKLDSDADALPIEHEQLHRSLVEQLIGKGLDPADLGELIVERESQQEPARPTAEPSTPERQSARQGQ